MSRSAHAPQFPNGGLTRGYQAAAGSFDEFVDSSGAPRPHWEPLLQALGALDPATLFLRMEQLNARVRETGIAYDLFSDPASATQPWRVDLVPLIIGAEEWQGLERALIQRARLFEAILADLYGPQHLLASGAIPHQLVFSDPSFLRPCHGLRPPGGFIQFFATDIARGPDGRWRVIDTHTETPAGIGYALANRMVHTNVAGDIFAACKAMRLAPFFQQLQASLARRANRVDPTIALLTPGPRHSDFFSHAYLARYLGLLLVEGGRFARRRRPRVAEDAARPDADRPDRALRRGRAWPTRSNSMHRVSRVPSDCCRRCARTPILWSTRLGSALAENRGLSAYLPKLARTILGEDLLIADGPRWWLGDPAIREHALANIEQVVIRPAHEGTARPGRAIPGIDPARLGAAELDTAAAGNRDQGRSDGGGGQGRFWHHAVTDAGRPGAQALCAAPVRDLDQHRLHGHAGRPGDDGRPRRDGCAQRARRRVARRLDCQRRDRRRRTSVCGARRSRRPASGARRRICPAAPPTTCSGSAATPNAPTGPCACCASP